MRAKVHLWDKEASVHKEARAKTYGVQLDARGRLVLPADVRDRLGLPDGARLMLTVDDEHVLRVEPMLDVARRLRGFARTPGRLLSDELVAERRQEAAREDN